MFLVSLASDDSTPDLADVSDTEGNDENRSTGKGKKREVEEAPCLVSKRPSTWTCIKQAPAESVENTNGKHSASVPKVIEYALSVHRKRKRNIC